MGLIRIFPAVILLDVNEDDIASDLDDTPPWDHVLKIASEKPAQAAGTRDDDGKHAAGAAVDLQIRDTAKGTAGANIDDLLLPQCTQTDGLRLSQPQPCTELNFHQGTASFPLQFYFAHYDTRIASYSMPCILKHSNHSFSTQMATFMFGGPNVNKSRIAPHFMLPQFEHKHEKMRYFRCFAGQ